MLVIHILIFILAWLSGYLIGLSRKGSNPLPPDNIRKPPLPSIKCCSECNMKKVVDAARNYAYGKELIQPLIDALEEFDSINNI